MLACFLQINYRMKFYRVGWDAWFGILSWQAAERVVSRIKCFYLTLAEQVSCQGSFSPLAEMPEEFFMVESMTVWKGPCLERSREILRKNKKWIIKGKCARKDTFFPDLDHCSLWADKTGRVLWIEFCSIGLMNALGIRTPICKA